VLHHTTASVGAPKDGTTGADEPSEEETTQDTLTRIFSEDLETQIHRVESHDEECRDLHAWYQDCTATVGQLLDIIDELHAATEDALHVLQEEDSLQRDTSVTSISSLDEVNLDEGHQVCYLSFGPDFYYSANTHDIWLDYDMVASKVLDKKRVAGVTMYKVEWKGAELNDPLVSWVPFDELECHDLIMKFEAKRGPPPRKDPHPKKSKSTRTCANPGAILCKGTSQQDTSKIENDPIIPTKDGGPKMRYKNAFGPQVTRLFHGTKRSFAQEIVADGFHLPVVRSGHGLGLVRPHMFGKGIYFTSSLEKASHFGDTILVCDVLTGRHKVMDRASHGLTGEDLWGQRHDSVYAPPGCGGNVFDEWVVYHPGQIRVIGFRQK